ncbi:T9SS sorting signal type C domain-containing protein [Urechidicola sp. KH5]
MKRKIYPQILIFLLSIQAIAQLTVRNTSFIYADDVVVFVEDDVNLEESTATFYLRNDSQLIQGTGTTGNSGTGKLSLYQDGEVDQFEYHYWGSPVGNTVSNTTGNEEFIANDVLHDIVNDTNSNLASFTVNFNGTSSPLNISTRWLYAFAPGTSYSNWSYLGQTGQLAAGYGFTMKGTSGHGGSQNYDFRGKPNSGDIAVNVLNGNYTLVGNPYASALDLVDFLYDVSNTSNISSTIYLWDQDRAVNSHLLADYYGGYASYTVTSDGSVETFTPATYRTYNVDGTINGGGPSLPLPPGGRDVRRYLPIAQGFMVEGTANGTAIFKNSHRDFVKESNPGSSALFRPATASLEMDRREESNSYQVENLIQYGNNGFSLVPNGFMRFRINIDFNNTYTRQLVQTFTPSATIGYDRGYESKTASTLTNDIHWLIGDIKYVSEANAYSDDLIIPLHLDASDNLDIRFRLFDIQQFDNNPIYLHDKQEDIYYDLITQQPELFVEAGSNSDRFEITFRTNSSLSVGDERLTELKIFQDNGAKALNIQNPNTEGLENLEIYDATGKLIYAQEINSNDSNTSISTSQLSTGVYFARLSLIEFGTPISQKIVIH